MNVTPPISSVPERDPEPEFGVSEKLTVPLPLPELPDVTVSQAVLLEAAVHAQPAEAVTLTVPVPPPGTAV